MTCEGQLFIPINDTFTANGSGTVTYSMVGGGSPPGEFDLSMSFSGYLNDSFFNGPFTLSTVAHGTTLLVSTTSGFIRTEQLQDFEGSGTFDGYTWNVTDQTATVDFSLIDPQGTEFQIQVTGAGSTSIVPEFPSMIIVPLFIAATLLAVKVYRRKSAT
jgi:hypothetical protein